MRRPEAIADVGIAPADVDVLLHEVLVDPPGLDNVLGDIVEDGEVGLWGEDDGHVGEIERTVLEGREHRHLDVGGTEPSVGQPRPEHRVHLRHVCAPKDEGIRVLEVVVTAHGLVHAEGAHESAHSRGHAVPCIGLDVVGAETGLHQLESGIAFPDRPLAGAEHADGGRPLLAQHLLEPVGHDVEGLVPGDRREAALLVILAILLAQERHRQAVVAVHDLGEKVALHAVEAAIDRRLDVAVRRDYPSPLGRDHDAAASAAEAAGRLGPGEPGPPGPHDETGGLGGNVHPGNRGCRGNGIGLYELAPR